MMQKTGSIWLSAAKMTLFIVVIGIFFIGQIIFYEDTIFFYWGNYVVLLLYAVNLYFTSKLYNAFNFGSVDIQEIILSWALCLIVTNTLQYFILSLIMDGLLPVRGFLLVLAAQMILALPLTYLIDTLYYRLNPAHSAIIIYKNEQKAQEYRRTIEQHRKRFEISRIVSQEEPLEELYRSMEESGSVFFLDVSEKQMEPLLKYCFTNSKRAYILPTFSGVFINTAGIAWISNAPMFLPKDPEPSIGARFIKRCMDIVISLLAIIAFSWLMIITWLAVRLYDRGPAIYKQVRITKGGKHFTIYKFRSMRPDAEDDGVPRLMAKGDSRVTPIGRFIRRTRIDEFPQLFNVLSGSMSLVGPRPERPEIAKQYEEIYPNFSLRTKVKGGITGLAQIYGRYNTAPDEKLFLDIMYIETFSIWQDTKLLLQTIKPLFKLSSTEGIENNNTTALK